MVIRFRALCFCSAVAGGPWVLLPDMQFRKYTDFQIALMHRDRYLMALDKNPIVTKAVTSAALTLAGDLICQVILAALGFSLCAMQQALGVNLYAM